ncbi:MAG TPA: ABC transporter permease [Ktedonosporobacter sp.]|jgi:peptide/nickel transport system permease protein|nr:ABC transporter permease [Ktedonosporobacter sp.]
MDTKDTKPDVIVPDTTITSLEAELRATASQPVAAETIPEAEVLAEGETTDTTTTAQKAPTPLQDSLRRLRRDKRAMVSIVVILFFIIIPIIGPPIYTHIGGLYHSDVNGTLGPQVYHDPFHQELTQQDQGPSAMYWLGTDSIGRDLLARLMNGMLISLIVAITVEVFNVVLGLTFGILAGYFGGIIDQFLARFTDVMFAFPGLLFAILLTGIFGSQADIVFSRIPIIGANGDARLLLVSLALTIASWPFMARLARGQTLQLKEQQFIEAARTAGTSNFKIIIRHIIPNLFSIIVVAATLDISGTIVGEAGLSFLGLGVQPPGSSLGLMISDATAVLDSHPWEILLPSLILALIVIALSFLGDGLRDAFDPRSKD